MDILYCTFVIPLYCGSYFSLTAPDVLVHPRFVHPQGPNPSTFLQSLVGPDRPDPGSNPGSSRTAATIPAPPGVVIAPMR